MHYFESVADSVVLALQGPEACQDLVVDAFYEDDPFEGIVVLDELVVLVPGCHGILSLQRAAVSDRSELDWRLLRLR